MKGRKPNIAKQTKIATVHFKVDTDQKIVSVPDKFQKENYPARTQTAIKHLQATGFHIQTSIIK